MPTENWTGLGEMLVRRRIELDPRYSNRQLFADERGVSYRIVSDVERGRRDNYEPGTIAAIEVAYELVAGSIARAVAGGSLEPAPAAVPRPLRPGIMHEGDGPDAEFIAKILRRLSPEDQAVIGFILKMNDGEGRPWTWERKLLEIGKYVDSIDGAGSAEGSGRSRPAAGLRSSIRARAFARMRKNSCTVTAGHRDLIHLLG